MKILVVDDEPLVSALLRQTLEAAGHEVEVAQKGSEATKLAKVFDPDLVLMDVDLGSGPDGIDVASAIKFQSPAVSIAFLTNVSEPRLAGKSAKHLPAGSAYLHKDRITDPEVLLRAIEETARGRARHLRDDLTTGHNLKKLSNSQLETIRLQDLASESLITYHPSFAGRTRVDQAFEAKQLTPNVVLEAIDSDVIKTYVQLGMGIGIIAEVALREALPPELVARPAGHLFGTNITRMAFKRGSYLRNFVYEFAQLVSPQLSREAIESAMNTEPAEQPESSKSP